MSYTAQAIVNNQVIDSQYVHQEALISDSMCFADPLLILEMEVEELYPEEIELFA